MIQVELHEVGQNRALHDRPTAKDLLRAHDQATLVALSHRLGFVLEGAGDVGHNDLYAEAVPGAPVGWERHVRRAVEAAGNNGQLRQELMDLLDRHAGPTDQDKVGAGDEQEDERPAEESRRTSSRLPANHRRIRESLHWRPNRLY
jgi:hypothetical protein